jgi:GTP cyclohydrolase I
MSAQSLAYGVATAAIALAAYHFLVARPAKRGVAVKRVKGVKVFDEAVKVQAMGERSPDQDALAAAYRAVLEALGEDVTRPGLLKTPARAAKALKFLTSGYSTTLEDASGTALFDVEDECGACDEEDAPEDGMALGPVIVKDIEIHSLCEHHLLPFHGVAHVGYLPAEGRVLGISKLARIADMYSRRLQMQERLTQQIASGVGVAAGARGVAVAVECSHSCMCMRGVQKEKSRTATSAFSGAFNEDPQLRDEFWRQVRSC